MSTEQVLASRAYQLRRWAATSPDGRRAQSQAMYAGLRAKFHRQAVELCAANGVDDSVEIEQCADRLYRAHMTDMARKAAASRRKANPTK